MKTLREYIADAETQGVAVGHFNISDSEQLWGIFNAARALGVPIIIGVSEGERSFIGARQAAALVRSIRESHEYKGEQGYPIFINADHTYSFEKVQEAVDAGYDSVIFDGAKLSFEENVAITKKCVEYAKRADPNILVEGELGYIGSSSKLLDAIPEGVEITEEHLTAPKALRRFVEETGVDLAAPAVGNLHGMLKSGKNPNIATERIRALREAGGVPLVLHGGSGISDENFTAAIRAGISVVHINTEIRIAYKKGIQIALQEHPDEIAPYKYMKGAMQDVQRVVERRLQLFNNL